MRLRQQWLRELGGLQAFSVKNKEWLPLLEEDTRQSLMIEGEFVDRRELKNILERRPTPLSAKAHKVLGYFDAASFSYEFAFQQFRTGEFALSKALLLQIHALMFRNDPHFAYTPGEWRRGDITITGAPVRPPPAHRVPGIMDRLLDLANKAKRDPLRIAAVLHAVFEHVHPFPDGNGRVGRILLNFILIAHGLPNIAIKGMEAERSDYVAALEEADPVVADVLRGRRPWTFLLQHPFLHLEEILNHDLAVAMDSIVCPRFEEKRAPLMTLEEVARQTSRKLPSFQTACSQKKYISIKRGRSRVTHPLLLQKPR